MTICSAPLTFLDPAHPRDSAYTWALSSFHSNDLFPQEGTKDLKGDPNIKIKTPTHCVDHKTK